MANQETIARKFEIVSVFASAGGVLAMSEILSGLPPQFPVPLIYQQPVEPSKAKALRNTLMMYTDLRVEWIEDGDRLEPQTLYLCPAGFWVVADSGIASLIPLGDDGQSQPAVQLAGSLIASYHNRCIFVLLNGVNMERAASLLRRHEKSGIILRESTTDNERPPVSGSFGLAMPLRDIVPALAHLLGPQGWFEGRVEDGAVQRPRKSVSAEFKKFLDELIALAMRMDDAPMATVQLFDEVSETFSVVAQRGFEPAFLRYVWRIGPDDDFALNRAVRERRAVLIEDIEADALYRPHLEMAQMADFRAVLATPMISAAGNLVGVLSTHFKEPKRVSATHMRTLYRYMGIAADVIQRLTSGKPNGIMKGR